MFLWPRTSAAFSMSVSSWSRFLDELEDHMTTKAAEQSLRAVVSWARYAEAFAYDADEQMFSLENPS